MEAAQNNRTLDKVAHSRVNHHQLLFCNWNIFTLTGKELELVEEAKRHHLDIVGISSTKRRGSGIVYLDGGWKLFYFGADPSESAQAGVGILTSPLLSDCVSEWVPLGSRVCILKLKVKNQSTCLLQVYEVCPNAASEYQAFVDEVNDALLRVSPSESTVLMGDFNTHIRTDTKTWKRVIGRHGVPGLNEKLSVGICCSNGLRIMNTFFLAQKCLQVYLVQSKYGAKIDDRFLHRVSRLVF